MIMLQLVELILVIRMMVDYHKVFGSMIMQVVTMILSKPEKLSEIKVHIQFVEMFQIQRHSVNVR